VARAIVSEASAGSSLVVVTVDNETDPVFTIINVTAAHKPGLLNSITVRVM
jgi:hypothetical protein